MSRNKTQQINSWTVLALCLILGAVRLESTGSPKVLDLDQPKQEDTITSKKSQVKETKLVTIDKPKGTSHSHYFINPKSNF